MPAKCCKEFYARIPDDVPVFTIVGWDKLDVSTVRHWIAKAAEQGVPTEKLKKGIWHLEEMEQFAATHATMMKLPD